MSKNKQELFKEIEEDVAQLFNNLQSDVDQVFVELQSDVDKIIDDAFTELREQQMAIYKKRSDFIDRQLQSINQSINEKEKRQARAVALVQSLRQFD